VTWLLLTGAGLVAETVVIVILGRTVTARYDRGDTPSPRTDAAMRDSSRGIGSGLVDDDRGALAEPTEVVRRAII